MVSNDLFSNYLRRAGLTLGPSLRNTRHSNLSLIKTWLEGGTVSFSYKAYNNFGSAVHSAWLVNQLGAWKLTQQEKKDRAGMLKALAESAIATKLLKICGVREIRKGAVLNGVKIKYTPDACSPGKIGIDLKTTSCATKKAFVESAFKYGYFRQGVTYSKARNLKEFYIIGIQKSFPYNVYIIWLQDPAYKDWMDYAEQELRFLLYFYKTYGNPRFKKAV